MSGNLKGAVFIVLAGICFAPDMTYWSEFLMALAGSVHLPWPDRSRASGAVLA